MGHPFEPFRVFRVFQAHGVRFILIGGMAGRVWGSPTTVAGPLDCLGTPSGTRGFADLMQDATELELDTDLRVHVASLDDVMRMKRAAGRLKDEVELEILEALKQERAKDPSAL